MIAWIKRIIIFTAIKKLWYAFLSARQTTCPLCKENHPNYCNACQTAASFVTEPILTHGCSHVIDPTFTFACSYVFGIASPFTSHCANIFSGVCKELQKMIRNSSFTYLKACQMMKLCNATTTDEDLRLLH